MTRGSGISRGHTSWPVDFGSKPGVASVTPKTWKYRTNPEGGGTSVHCWGKLKVLLPGESLHMISGGSLGCFFLPALFGVTLVLDSGSTPLSEKVGNPPSMGHGQKMRARNPTSAARQRRGFRRHLCPKKRLCRFSRPAQTPTFHSKTCAALRGTIVSLTMHAVHSEGGTWQICIGVQVFCVCDAAPAASCNSVFTWVDWDALLT